VEKTLKIRGVWVPIPSHFFKKEKESLLKKNDGKKEKEKENRKREERNGECSFGKAFLFKKRF